MFIACQKRAIVSTDALVEAFHQLLDCLSDLKVDVPLAPKYVSKMISTMIQESALPVSMLDGPALPAEFRNMPECTAMVNDILAEVGAS